MLDFSQFFLYFKTYGWNGGGINVDDVSQEPNGRELAVQAAGRGDRDGVYLGLISAGQAGQSVSDSDLFRLLVKADNSAIERYSREAEEAGRRNDQDGVQAAQVMLEAHRERLVMDGRELISSQTPPLHPEAASLEFWQASWDKVRQGESAGSPDGLLITAFHVASKGGRVDDGDLYRSLSQEYGARQPEWGRFMQNALILQMRLEFIIKLILEPRRIEPIIIKKEFPRRNLLRAARLQARGSVNLSIK